MRNFFPLTVVAGAVTASSLTTLRSVNSTCSFELTATGGQTGSIGSLSDGQLRIGGATTGNDYGNNNLETTSMEFTIKNSAIWDENGSGCILAVEVDGSTQFQCDAGKTPTNGFSIATNGSLEYRSNSVFFACAASDVEYNLYTVPVVGQAKCYEIGLMASGCTGSSGSATSTFGTFPFSNSTTAVAGSTGSLGSIPSGSLSGSVSSGSPGSAPSNSVESATPASETPIASVVSVPAVSESVSASVSPTTISTSPTGQTTTAIISSVVGVTTPATSLAESASSPLVAGETSVESIITISAVPVAPGSSLSAPIGSSPAEKTVYVTVNECTAPSSSIAMLGSSTVPVEVGSGFTFSATAVTVVTGTAVPFGSGTATISGTVVASVSSVVNVSTSTPGISTSPNTATGLVPEITTTTTITNCASASSISAAGGQVASSTGGFAATFVSSGASTTQGSDVTSVITMHRTSSIYATTTVSSTVTSCPASIAGCKPGGVAVVTLSSLISTSVIPFTTETLTSAAATGFSTLVSGASVTTGIVATSTAIPSSCPLTLQNNYFGSTTQNYQYPHLIIPVSSSTPSTAAGTQYFGTISSNTSTIYNFDIPTSYAGKSCSLIMLLPEHDQLETSAYTSSGSGSISFEELSLPASESTTYNNQPSVSSTLGTFDITVGSSTRILDMECPAGETLTYELQAVGDTYLYYFQDWNPSPIGLFITYC